eukprot:6799609-Prymnesium_polylepis.1
MPRVLCCAIGSPRIKFLPAINDAGRECGEGCGMELENKACRGGCSTAVGRRSTPPGGGAGLQAATNP